MNYRQLANELSGDLMVLCQNAPANQDVVMAKTLSIFSILSERPESELRIVDNMMHDVMMRVSEKANSDRLHEVTSAILARAYLQNSQLKNAGATTRMQAWFSQARDHFVL